MDLTTNYGHLCCLQSSGEVFQNERSSITQIINRVIDDLTILRKGFTLKKVTTLMIFRLGSCICKIVTGNLQLGIDLCLIKFPGGDPLPIVFFFKKKELWMSYVVTVQFDMITNTATRWKQTIYTIWSTSICLSSRTYDLRPHTFFSIIASQSHLSLSGWYMPSVFLEYSNTCLSPWINSNEKLELENLRSLVVQHWFRSFLQPRLLGKFNK